LLEGEVQEPLDKEITVAVATQLKHFLQVTVEVEVAVLEPLVSVLVTQVQVLAVLD
jgi:hypothetical protein